MGKTICVCVGGECLNSTGHKSVHSSRVFNLINVYVIILIMNFFQISHFNI